MPALFSFLLGLPYVLGQNVPTSMAILNVNAASTAIGGLILLS